MHTAVGCLIVTMKEHYVTWREKVAANVRVTSVAIYFCWLITSDVVFSISAFALFSVNCKWSIQINRHPQSTEHYYDHTYYQITWPVCVLICRVRGSNCRQTRPTDYWYSYGWPTWFLLHLPNYLELFATTLDRHVIVIIQFQKLRKILLFQWHFDIHDTILCQLLCHRNTLRRFLDLFATLIPVL